MELTQEDFHSFCSNIFPDIIRGTSKGAVSNSSGGSGGIVTSSEVQSFKKSIDKSQPDFPEFNGVISKWIPIKQTYTSVTANHGIVRILDDSPVSAEDLKDRELFNAQNQYFYNILKVKVKIKGRKAKVIVNQHALTLDGKTVWRKFKEHYEHHSIVSMNKGTFFEKLSNMRLSDQYRGATSKLLTDFENVVTEMQISTGESMEDSDLVGFLTAVILGYGAFNSIKASLDTNALMNKQEILYDGMLHVLYNNCPEKSSTVFVKYTNISKMNDKDNNKDYDCIYSNKLDDNAWKKDYTKWLPIKIFKDLPEKEQNSRREAQAKAKQQHKANKNACSGGGSSKSNSTDSASTTYVSSLTSGGVNEVPRKYATTFREIMSAKNIEMKKADNGDTWIHVVKANRKVCLSNVNIESNEPGALLDSGANIGLQGSNMRMSHQEHGSVSVIGTGGLDSRMDNLPLVTCGGVATNSFNEQVLVVMISAASYGRGESILSRFQLEHYGCKLYDRPRVLGGRQVLTTPDDNKLKLKLKFHSGLMYLPLTYPSDNEVTNLPHVYRTSDEEQWNPDAFNDRDIDDQWFNSISNEPEALDNDEFFDSRDGFVLESNYYADINRATRNHKQIDFEKLRKFFLYKPIETIKKTFDVTTQFAETVWFNTPRLPLRRHCKSRVPFMNVRHLTEGFATDIIFFDCKAHDGSTYAQIYIYVDSQFVSLEGMSTKSQMPRTLLNFICTFGAMQHLWRDIAKEEDSKVVNDLLRNILAPNRFSEPYN